GRGSAPRSGRGDVASGGPRRGRRGRPATRDGGALASPWTDNRGGGSDRSRRPDRSRRGMGTSGGDDGSVPGQYRPPGARPGAHHRSPADGNRGRPTGASEPEGHGSTAALTRPA